MGEFRALLFATASLVSSQALAQISPSALPSGGSVSSGQATFGQSAGAMTVTQTSPKAIITWQGFDIGAQAAVTFSQPSAGAVALNRVLSDTPSQIYGTLSANGQVFLVNPAGITFGPGAVVNAGALVASTMTIKDADFLAGTLAFQRTGSIGVIRNQGNLNAAAGGFIGLLAPGVINEGVVTAKLGTVALAAGEQVTLSFDGKGGLTVQVDPATVATLIENHTLIAAPDGSVILSSQAAAVLAGGVIGNSGVIEADGLTTAGGVVTLTASGGLTVSGTISANGAGPQPAGKVALNFADLTVPGGEAVSVKGQLTMNGKPYVLIDSVAGLNRINSTLGGNYALVADLDLSAIPSFISIGSSATSFTGNFEGFGHRLSHLSIDQVSKTGVTAQGLFGVNSGTVSDIHLVAESLSGTVDNPNFSYGVFDLGGVAGVNFGTIRHSSATGTMKACCFVNAVGGLVGNNYGTIEDGRAGFTIDVRSSYAVTEDVGGLVGVNGGTIGDSRAISSITYSGTLHDRGAVVEFGGLAGYNGGLITGSAAEAAINAGDFASKIGGLVGSNVGTITDDSAVGTIRAGGDLIGGLVGVNEATISRSGALTQIEGNIFIGGLLVGGNDATITDSAASGTFQALGASKLIGGLAGFNNSNATITGSKAEGIVLSGTLDMGGLAGSNQGTIRRSSAAGRVTVNDSGGDSGGLVGLNTGIVDDSIADAAVIGTGSTINLGGLVGRNEGLINPGTATGSVTGAAGSKDNGGLAGLNDGTIKGGTSAAVVRGGSYTGGLVGFNTGTGLITGSSVIGPTQDANTLGGLAGLNFGTIQDSFTTAGALVIGIGPESDIGGLVGQNDGTISGSQAAGAVTSGAAGINVGALVGLNVGTITSSTGIGTVNGR